MGPKELSGSNKNMLTQTAATLTFKKIDDVDKDNDSFNDCSEDLCLNTIPDDFEELKKNHYAGNWDGCSCTDMLKCKPGNNEGELKYGCTKGTIDDWLGQRGWALSCDNK